LSRGAAAYAGISWGRTITLAMLVSGLLAGLGGAGESLGLQGRYYNQAAGYGFTAIAVGLVGRNNPLGVVLAALLFGALSSGATRMQNTAGTSKEIVQVMQALVILSVAAFAAAGRFRFWQRLSGPFADRPSGQAGSDGDLGPDLEPSAAPPRV
jgi:simple sugar transport system permease protein